MIGIVLRTPQQRLTWAENRQIDETSNNFLGSIFCIPRHIAARRKFIRTPAEMTFNWFLFW
jgi:hypothetical protein